MSDSMETTPSTFTGTDGRKHSIFGPSNMEIYLRCPRLWHYSTSYVPAVEVFDPRPLIGTLMHRAVRIRIEAGQLAPAQHDALLSDLTTAWEPNPTLELEAGQDLLSKAIKTSLSSLEIMLQGKTVEAVEESLITGTVDLVLRGQGGVEIWDHKWHLKQDPKWVDRELRKTETMSQLWDYALEWLETREEFPVLIGKHMIAGSPNKAWRFGVAVTEERLRNWKESREKWLDSAQQDHFIATMEEPAHRSLPPMNLASCWDYGQCKFYGTCHNPDGNQTPPVTLWKPRAS